MKKIHITDYKPLLSKAIFGLKTNKESKLPLFCLYYCTNNSKIDGSIFLNKKDIAQLQCLVPNSSLSDSLPSPRYVVKFPVFFKSLGTIEDLGSFLTKESLILDCLGLIEYKNKIFYTIKVFNMFSLTISNTFTNYFFFLNMSISFYIYSAII